MALQSQKIGRVWKTPFSNPVRYVVCSNLHPWSKYKVNGQLEIFFMINSQATISISLMFSVKVKAKYENVCNHEINAM